MEKIFKSAGFRTELHKKIKGYEIDVLAKFKTFSIAIECKQRESGSLTVRNLIHEWSGKNKIINCDMVLLAIHGVNVSISDKKLAKDVGIKIWDTDKIDKFLDTLTNEKENLQLKVLDELDIKTNEVEKLREEREKNWKPDYKKILFDYDFHKNFGKEVIAYGAEHTYLVTCRYDLDGTPRPLEEQLKETVNNSLDPIDTLIFTYEVGEKDVEIAKRNGVKCIVCKDIKNKTVKSEGSGLRGILYRNLITRKEPEVNKNNSGIIILTEKDLYEIQNKLSK